MPGLKRALPAETHVERTGHEGAINGAQSSEFKRTRLSETRNVQDASGDETDEDIQTIQATQLHERQRTRRSGQNIPAENGIIECITLVNFMCHGFLEVEIGPLINFVIGHNGSGKSAVLTALTVCLGGKASATNRASSLKSFIKEGTETCTLRVKIKNGGDDGYQQDLYGSSITVERSFSRSGASTFKIKNSVGRIISSRRCDLEDISDYYALQLDNPINVLTQDNARQFLSGSGPTEKYKFFIRGVQLEQLNRDYDLLHESISQMEATFEDKRLHLEQLREQKERAKATFDLLGHHENIFSQMQFVRSQLAWCQVEEQEDILRQANEALRKTVAELAMARENIVGAAEKLSTAEISSQNSLEEVSKMREDVENSNAELAAARDLQDSYKTEALNAQQDERSIDEEISSVQKALEKTKNEIEIEKSRLDDVNGGSITRNLEQMEANKRGVGAARQAHRDHLAARGSIIEKLEAIEQELKQCDDQKRKKMEEKAACEESIRVLKTQGQQRQFKPNMDKLLNAIASSKDFREKPVGPVGNYIQLMDPQWLSILEKSFGDVLEAFIVISKSDQAVLGNLMRRVNCQSSIIIGSPNRIDTSQHEPDPEYTTVLRVLRIEEEIVKRQLVINQSIEQTVLIPSIKEAREFMNRGRVPNVKQCYSHQINKPNAGERFSYGLGGALNSSFIPPWNKHPRIRTQAEDSIAFEQSRLQRLERELHEINNGVAKIRSRAATCKRELFTHDREERSLKADIQSAQHLCDEMQERIDADNIEEGKLDALKQTMLDLEQELAHGERVRRDAIREKEKHTEKWKSMEPSIREIEARIRNAESRLNSTKLKSRRCEEIRQSALFQKNKLHEELAKLQNNQLILERDEIELQKTVAEFTEGASKVGSRVPIDDRDSEATLNAKLIKLEEERRNHERRVGGSAEKITREYELATDRHAEAFAMVETEEKLAQLFRQTLSDREERWRLFRQKISARARATFVFVLSERSFHGHLKINHGQRKLEIAVQPDATQRDRSGREASSLSGGEKSYSTICLLLSLWDAVGAPIRCLDEFDVYMDNVNRDISMKLLVRAARNAVGRQFILISPQAGTVEASSDVKIIKLRDPERNQMQLNLG